MNPHLQQLPGCIENEIILVLLIVKNTNYASTKYLNK